MVILSTLVLLLISLLLFWKTLILQDELETVRSYLSKLERTMEHIEEYLDDKDQMWRLF